MKEKTRLSVIKMLNGVQGGKKKNFHDNIFHAPSNPEINNVSVANLK